MLLLDAYIGPIEHNLTKEEEGKFKTCLVIIRGAQPHSCMCWKRAVTQKAKSLGWWDHEQMPWRGMTSDHDQLSWCCEWVCGWDTISNDTIYMDPLGEHLRPSRRGGPGTCWDSPCGSGEDTEAEDASLRAEKSWLIGVIGVRKGTQYQFSIIKHNVIKDFKYECSTKLIKYHKLTFDHFINISLTLHIPVGPKWFLWNLIGRKAQCCLLACMEGAAFQGHLNMK